LVAEQFDKLNVTPVETTSDYQSDTRFNKLSVLKNPAIKTVSLFLVEKQNILTFLFALI